MNNLKIYCVTNKKLKFLEQLPLKLVGVGKDHFSNFYLKCNDKDNIDYKEQFYSELTFHYWYWKNLLSNEKCKWVGFCQKRRFWIKTKLESTEVKKELLKNNLLTKIDSKYEKYDSFICNPIKISGSKKIKILKRGWRNVLNDPTILFLKKKQNIKLHFDMHHGYKNLEKAINHLNYNDRDDFKKYVNERNYFNPNIMCIARIEILNNWFQDLFEWLEKCESEFGFDNLKGYDTLRLYAYLAERYMSFWFKKYTKYKEQPWAFVDV